MNSTLNVDSTVAEAERTPVVTLRLLRLAVPKGQRPGEHYNKLQRLIPTCVDGFDRANIDTYPWQTTPLRESGWRHLDKRHGLTREALEHLWLEEELEIQQQDENGNWADVFSLPEIKQK